MKKKYEQISWIIYILTKFGFDSKKILEYNENEYIMINKEKIKKFILNYHYDIETCFRTKRYDWKKIIKEDNKWFGKVFRYINERIKKVFKITLKKKEINDDIKLYIKGNDFWNDNEVTYKNIKLMEKIIKKQKEIDIFVDININIHSDEERLNNNTKKDKEIEIVKYANKSNCNKCNLRISSYNHLECLCCRFNINPDDYDNINIS